MNALSSVHVAEFGVAPRSRDHSFSGSSLISRARLVLTVGTVLFVLVCMGGVQPQIYLSSYLLLYALTAVWVLLKAFGYLPPTFPSSALAISIGGVLCVPGFQLVAHTTTYAAATQTQSLHLLAAVCVFVTAADISRTPQSAATTAVFLPAVLGIYSAEALLQLFLFPHRVYGIFPVPDNSPMGSLVDRDHFGVVVELLFPLSVFAAFRARSLSRACIFAIFPCLALVAVVSSGSRGAALGVAVEIVLMLTWAKRSGSDSAAYQSLFSNASRAAVVSTLAITLVLSPFFVVTNRVAGMRVPVENRLQLAKATLAVWSHYRWFGSGLGTWQFVYPKFARFDDGQLYEHAHSEYLEWVSEAGVAGCLDLLFVLAVFSAAARRRLSEVGTRRQPPADTLGGTPLGRLRARVSSGTTSTPTTAPLLIALIGCGCHAAVDFPFHIPGLLLLFAFIAGLAI